MNRIAALTEKMAKFAGSGDNVADVQTSGTMRRWKMFQPQLPQNYPFQAQLLQKYPAQAQFLQQYRTTLNIGGHGIMIGADVKNLRGKTLRGRKGSKI